MNIDDILNAAPVIPVIVIDDLADALPLAEALVRGGLPVLEVTLRTAAGLDAIRAMSAVPGAIVGAGTVLEAAQYDAAIAAGARFVVSPGLTERLALHAMQNRVPLLPGTATASEIMAAREAGFRRVKFFPAESSGGVAALKGFGSVFRDIRFCPTGGITAGHRAGLPGLVERGLRRRLVADAGRCHRPEGLGSRRAARARSGQPAARCRALMGAMAVQALSAAVECVVDARCTLGESPVWSASEQALYWVDIDARRPTSPLATGRRHAAAVAAAVQGRQPRAAIRGRSAAGPEDRAARL